MALLQRVSHAGAAVPSALVNPLSLSGLSFVLSTVSGWPTGAGGQPFFVVVDPGNSFEEKILCSSQSGGNVNVASGGRGADGTTAFAHTAGAVVEHVGTAIELDDDNDHVYNTGRDDHLNYAPTSGARPFTGLVTMQAGLTDTGIFTQNGNATINGNETVTGTLGVGGDISGRSLAISGLSGAAVASRYVGATLAGPPTTGIFNLGDYVVSQDGSVYVCTTAGSPGAWRAGLSGAPRGNVATTTGPATQTDFTSGTVISLPANLVSGRRYKVTGYCFGSQQTSTGTPQCSLADSAGYTGGSIVRLFSTLSTPANFAEVGTAVWVFAATATATVTFQLNVSTSAGAFRVVANASQITVEDIGV